jgi:hypothetical protein
MRQERPQKFQEHSAVANREGMVGFDRVRADGAQEAVPTYWEGAGGRADEFSYVICASHCSVY